MLAIHTQQQMFELPLEALVPCRKSIGLHYLTIVATKTPCSTFHYRCTLRQLMVHATPILMVMVLLLLLCRWKLADTLHRLIWLPTQCHNRGQRKRRVCSCSSPGRQAYSFSYSGVRHPGLWQQTWRSLCGGLQLGVAYCSLSPYLCQHGRVCLRVRGVTNGRFNLSSTQCKGGCGRSDCLWCSRG
jgi:hypothetical protein